MLQAKIFRVFVFQFFFLKQLFLLKQNNIFHVKGMENIGTYNLSILHCLFFKFLKTTGYNRLGIAPKIYIYSTSIVVLKL